MPTVDEIERDDEELADYDVGFRDRLDCEPWEASPGEDLVLSKGRTEEQRWARLKALHGMQAQTRPRVGSAGGMLRTNRGEPNSKPSGGEWP